MRSLTSFIAVLLLLAPSSATSSRAQTHSTILALQSRPSQSEGLGPDRHCSAKTHCPSDTNFDNVVGAADLAVVLSCWGDPYADLLWCPCLDVDPDGDIDAADLAAMLANWGPCLECGDGVIVEPEECDPPDDVDCNDNCQLIPLPDCCFSHPTAGCEDPVCESTVCANDPFCCDTIWGGACVDEAYDLCPECRDCCFAHLGPGCTDSICQKLVCAAAPTCCIFSWEQGCADLAALFCGQCMP